MKKLATSFDHMAGRLQTLVTAHSELLANVSHELRTPLARARVVLDLAREGAMVDREAITEIASDLDELEHLISEVLTTARLSLAEGQASDLLARLPKQPIDLCDVVDQAAERFRKRFAGIALDVAKPNQAVTCVAAETLLHRALNNLLDNAAGHGGGAPVHLTLEAKNGVSVLEVRDEGPGMRPEDAARAFEPFYRADPSRSKVGGLGLGLTLAHRVALAHGGKIALTSEVGRGRVSATPTARLWRSNGARRNRRWPPRLSVHHRYFPTISGESTTVPKGVGGSSVWKSSGFRGLCAWPACNACASRTATTAVEAPRTAMPTSHSPRSSTAKLRPRSPWLRVSGLAGPLPSASATSSRYR
jgi:hypothetical protein